MVNVLATVIGMKASNPKRKLCQHGFQYRYQIRFTDVRGSTHDLPLRNFIHRVNVKHPFHSVPITLMHGVHPQIPRAVIRLWPTAFADAHLRRLS